MGAKSALKKILLGIGFSPELLRKLGGSPAHYSNLQEELVLRKYLESIPAANKTDFVVDIAAADGITMSNTYALYKAGLPGLAVEYSSELFARLSAAYREFPSVKLMRVKATPETVLGILKSGETPKNFSLLNLDIDSYDYFVLDTLLGEYRPALICAEVNEKIPPPLKFTVKYDPAHAWNSDHFYGQSISKLHELCEKHGYDIVELHYNNAFLIAREANRHKALTPEAAYESGYRSKPDRREKFPWNADVEALLELSPERAKSFLEGKFRQYQGKYELS